MEGVVMSGGFGDHEFQLRLAPPRASEGLNVYGLSVDVFVLIGMRRG